METAEPRRLADFGDFHPRWHRSSKCPTGACVEVSEIGIDTFALRDSKLGHLLGDQPVIVTKRAEYIAFLAEIVGEAPPGSSKGVLIEAVDGGNTIFKSALSGVELQYNVDEMAAFVLGAKSGEFGPSDLVSAIAH